MKWKANKEGDVRHIRRFAWLPTEVQGYVLWLEFYYERQTYVPHKWLIGYRWKWGRSPAP